jgi:MraZ protein
MVLCAGCEERVGERGDYQGEGLGLVDDKGRVAIPNALRATLAKNAPRDDGKDGGQVIVGAHPKHRCLIAYDAGYLPLLRAKLERRESAREETTGEVDFNIKRRGMSGEAVPFDGSGRFIMPGFPRHYARIKEHAFFWGAGDYIEVWNPRSLMEADGMDELVREACDYHCATKGVAW